MTERRARGPRAAEDRRRTSGQRGAPPADSAGRAEGDYRPGAAGSDPREESALDDARERAENGPAGGRRHERPRGG